VYPALAVLQTLGSDADSVLWVGGEGGMEAEMISRLNIPFSTIPAAGVHGVGLRTLPSNILRLLRGVFASRKLLSEFKPDALLFTGGFVAVPMAVAGIRTPSLLFIPDIEPGLAIKAIARFSDCIAMTAAESKPFFRFHKRLVVSGYPTRPELAGWTIEKAREHFGLHSQKPVLLVFGGSKGARSINQAVFEILPALLQQAQVLHITGQTNFSEAQSMQNELTENMQEYHPFAYLHDDMGAAFAAVDLAVSRAGASILGELPLFGLPAVLVPYPYAWRYQKVNADYLVKNGGALMLKDESLKTELLATVSDLLHSPDRLSKMKASLKSLAIPQASQILAATLCDLVAEQKGGRS
jgi:UDP-N-acetylglucosamine--N-acetylmuramyl-(pentapeptide) pyrophosphoryl-undecaprenol N-acetylglucosamine transferase